VKSSFNELIAYNIAGYTPQQLWSFRNVEHSVKFDTGLNCYYEAWKSNGVEQKYDSYCWNKEVHWTTDGNTCSQGSKTVSISSTVSSFWSYFDKFTVYEGIVSDPYYASGVTFHRMKHSTENRWIWFRTTDLAIVYEQYYDGTTNSYVKMYEGGIKDNLYLFTSDFRIPKCTNPFLTSMASFKPSPDAAFSLQSVVEPRPIPSFDPIYSSYPFEDDYRVNSTANEGYMTFNSSGKATFHDISWNNTIQMKPGENISFS